MKPKLKYNTIYNHSKEKEILNYKLNKICTEPVCWRLQRDDEEMKEDVNKLIDITVLMDWKTQHSNDVNSP